MKDFEPAYLKTIREEKLSPKIEKAYQLLKSCVLCGRRCKVNRLEGQVGFCKVADELIVSSYGPHHGEEAPLVGSRGSGTIFLTYCNLGCVFCQNYDISHLGHGNRYTIDRMAEVMLKIQKMGCHNLNLVTPTHQLPMILKALKQAALGGLEIPVVWNCGGYESREALQILDGIVDIYMPDFKFWDEKPAARYAYAPDYPRVAREALKEMHRQVGDLKMDSRGIAQRGLLVRHLVMPNNLAGTGEFVDWLAREVSPDTYINVMAQYRPCYKAGEYKEINRRPTSSEYNQAVKWAKEAGLRLDSEVAPRRRWFLIDI